MVQQFCIHYSAVPLPTEEVKPTSDSDSEDSLEYEDVSEVGEQRILRLNNTLVW